jgi:DNA-binding transcriptional ArsR family regulator
MPQIWALVPQKSDSDSEPIVTFSPTPPVRSECNVDFADTGHDVWRARALGKTKRLVYLLLDPNQGRTCKDIAQARDYKSVRTAQYHLSTLEACGLACRGPDGLWRRLERDLDELGRELGVNGKGADQRERHAKERENYLDLLGRRGGVE